MSDNTEIRTQAADVTRYVIKKRRSTRHFADRAIPESTLLQLVEAGIWAPSGSNWQNQRFLIIDDQETIARIGRGRFVWPYKSADTESIKQTHPSGIIGHARALIVVFSDSSENDRRGTGEYYIWQALEIQNCAASIENILLLATSLGIANCWVSASEEMNYTRLLSNGSWHALFGEYDIPLHFRIHGIVLLGFPIRTDADGFPAGEEMHGATIWQSTSRRPLDHYLIRKRDAMSVAPLSRPSVLQKFLLGCAARTLRTLLRIVRMLDRYIHRIEINQILGRSR